MKPLLTFLYAYSVLVGSSLAQDQPSSADSSDMIEVTAYFIKATPEEFSMAIASSGATTGVLSPDEFAKALTFLKNSDATILGNPRAVTISGQQCTTQSVRELPYPSEYSIDQKTGKSFPISFETINLGVTFEFVPKLRLDGLIDISLKPSVVTFLGFVDYSSPPTSKADKVEDLLKDALKEGGAWQPILSRFSASSQVVLESGQTVLIGGTAEEISPHSAADKSTAKKSTSTRLIYVFVTVHTVKR